MNFRVKSMCSRCRISWLVRIPASTLAPINMNTCSRNFSTKTENEWKDGAVVYSTSKAARHSVNQTVGIDEKVKSSWKPLIFGSLTFAAIIYIMFFYKGEKNDVFQTITPDSVTVEYQASLDQASTNDRKSIATWKNLFSSLKQLLIVRSRRNRNIRCASPWNGWKSVPVQNEHFPKIDPMQLV